MHRIHPIIRLARQSRIPLACLLALASLCLLWAGFDLPGLRLGRPAVAESSPQDPALVPGGVSPDAALYLKSTVDAAALALGGVLAAEDPAGGAGEEKRRALLASSLGDLTFKLGGSVYFSAWQGTRAVYSPLSPDAEDMDFSAQLDARGVAFVRRMEEAALGGGGFVAVLLPKAPVGESGHGSVAAGPVENAVATDLADIPNRIGRSGGNARPPEPVEQVVYARPVPHSDLHIAAFLPLGSAKEPGAGQNIDAFDADELMQKGLRLSGFSLAGLAGLLLVPGASHRTGGRSLRKSPCDRKAS